MLPEIPTLLLRKSDWLTNRLVFLARQVKAFNTKGVVFTSFVESYLHISKARSEKAPWNKIHYSSQIFFEEAEYELSKEEIFLNECIGR